MEFKCCKCGNSTDWDPVKEGGSTPPGFVMKLSKGTTEVFCLACWPPRDKNEAEENKKLLPKKFFIPAAEDKEQEHRVYESIKEFLGKELGAHFDDRRIFSLQYTHDGKEYYAQVGKLHSLNGERVVAILHETARRLYHVCTTNRGVLRGGSILVGEHSVESFEDFEAG